MLGTKDWVLGAGRCNAVDLSADYPSLERVKGEGIKKCLSQWYCWELGLGYLNQEEETYKKDLPNLLVSKIIIEKDNYQ